jgi:ABC-type nickel/cobalt efflux system permease component RcnA
VTVLADGASLGLVLLAALVLGVRHATDPDHVAAVTTLVVAEDGRRPRGAGLLGLAWGFGHALTLFAFGLPLLLVGSELPAAAQNGAAAASGLLVAALAARLLRHWRAGRFHVHEHEHAGGTRHAHVHVHADGGGHAHTHGHRTPLGAFMIGLLHGFGGSAGLGVLLVATIDSQAVAVAALALLALGTALSMTALSSGVGVALARGGGKLVRATPAVGLGGLAFGLWYGLGALEVLPYPL